MNRDDSGESKVMGCSSKVWQLGKEHDLNEINASTEIFSTNRVAQHKDKLL